MVINFSRHVKRRAKLYNISESVIKKMLMDLDLETGKHEVIKDVLGFKYPIKLVVAVEDNIVTVITSYPLKKGVSNDSTL